MRETSDFSPEQEDTLGEKDASKPHKPGNYSREYFLGQRGKKSKHDWLKSNKDKISKKSELRSAKLRTGLITLLFERHKLNKSDKVLDVGAGRYHLEKTLKEEGIESMGLDLSRAGFKLTKEKREGQDEDEMEAVQATGLSLPFAENEFSTIHCSDVLEHLTDKDEATRFLNELGRVGKKMLIVQLTPTDYMLSWAIHHDQTHRLKMSIKEWNKMLKDWGEENGWSIKEKFWQRYINKVIPNQPPAWVLVKDPVAE